MAFGDELTAFRAYAKALPNNAVFLVDTYDSREGVRHAVQVASELRAAGHEMLGVRLDSGDLAWISSEVRKALDAAGHDALLVVDTVSSLASIEFCMDDWRVDVAVCGSQKGLMLPPGLGILGVSRRALALAAQGGGSPRHFWDWEPIMRENRIGLFPYTPATLMLFGLREALTMLVDEEGLDAVYARHARLAAGVRAAVRAWGLRTVCEEPAYASNSITAVWVPEGFDSNILVKHARERYNLSLGGGIAQLNSLAFRLGHLGSLNELEVLGMIGGTELTFAELDLGIEPGSGLLACQQTFLQQTADVPAPALVAAT
jgi:alanine-glyoxylate transaminase/serine-glyoxylate transaminase/serine-pyruvate transaminase